MSAKCPLICSAVELWYKMMLEIRNQSELTENHIKRKAAGYQRLSSNWLWLFMAVYKPSFADAEFREDVLQDFVGGDGAAARDGAEVGDDLADFFAQKIGRKAVGETFEGFTEGFAGRRKRFVMAAVRDDRIAVVERFGVDGLPQGVAQGVDTLAMFGRNADNAFGKPPCGRSLVGLVDDGQEFLPGTERKIRGGNRTRERRGVDHMDDDLRPFDA